MSTLAPYETFDTTLNVHVIWDTKDQLPDMGRSEYERRAARLAGIMPISVRPLVEQRLTDDADHQGEHANPYDAGQLHMWELYRIEAVGANARIPGVVDAWVGDDGIPAIMIDSVQDLSAYAMASEHAGWPVLRVWLQGEEDMLPFRMLLIRS